VKNDSQLPATRHPRLRLRLSATAETILRSGHPWVYSRSVREQNREGVAGELAVIFDRNDKFLAIGFYDPTSPIRVRVLHCGKPVAIDLAFWSARLAGAIARREKLFDERTTGYRILNGESDGWPGLVLDRYGQTFVPKIYASAWLERLDEIVPLICEQLGPERIVLRLSRNINPARWNDGQILCGEPLASPTIFSETGIWFEADVLRGQKTGFFLDQRENRRIVESLSGGRRVLNAFSFSGGFSLYAARGGAKSVTDLDISSHALASAERNFTLK
jgi:23S rRNA (cytosine1962-C5)-methyltransferase